MWQAACSASARPVSAQAMTVADGCSSAISRARFGPDSAASVDYPDYGYALTRAIERGDADVGVALCGSGIGISIAVNRNPAARCALVSEPLSAALARQHNDANVIALGARLIGTEMAKACVAAFLDTPFLGDRHQRRVEKLSHPERSPA